MSGNEQRPGGEDQGEQRNARAALAASSATEAPPDAPDTGPRRCAINSTSMCAAYGCFEIGRCGRRPARPSGGTA